MSSTRSRARLCVVELTYHQLDNQQPTSTDQRWSRPLNTDAPPWVFSVVVGNDWQPLIDAKGTSPAQHYREDWGMLLLSNEEGKGRLTQPSPEEVSATASKVVELGVTTPHWLTEPAQVLSVSILLPGESLRFQPSDVSRLRLRCYQVSGSGMLNTARCTVILIPA